MKDLHNTNMNDVTANTSDLKVTGDPGAWVCLCKASSQQDGWMKSTKLLRTPLGVIVQTTSEFRDAEGNVTGCTDALVFVPGATLQTFQSE